jgi:hypothetical protein
VGALKSHRGAKTDLIVAAIDGFAGQFTLSDLERASPGVSRDMLRKVLKDLQRDGQVECLGRGPGAPWKIKRVMRAREGKNGCGALNCEAEKK